MLKPPLTSDRVTLLRFLIESEGLASSREPMLGAQQRPDSLPLSYAQRRLWFLDRLTPGKPVYNIAAVLELHGTLNIAVLRHAVSSLAMRHESLRTYFPASMG